MTHAADCRVPEISLTRDAASQLLGLGACTFGIACTFYLTLSSGPAHLATLGGESAAGAATTVSTFATVASSLIAPKLIARWGRRVVFAIAAIALGFPCLALFGNSLAIAEMAAAIRGLGLGFAFIATGGLAARLAPSARRGEILGLYGLAFSTPAIFAVPIGLWLLDRLGPTELALVATVSALLPLLGLGVFPGRETMAHRSWPWQLRRTPMGWSIVVQTGGAAAVGMLITVFATAASAQATTGTVAVAMALHGLAAALAKWCAGRIGDRHGQRKLIAAGSVLSLTATLLLATSGGAPMIAVSAALLGVAFGVQQSATLNLMLTRASRPETDMVNAAWNIAYDAGLGLGALAYGALAPALGGETAIIAIAVVIALTAAASFKILERGREERAARPMRP